MSRYHDDDSIWIDSQKKNGKPWKDEFLNNQFVGIAEYAKEVKPGYLYIACDDIDDVDCTGCRIPYIDEAVQNGAKEIIADPARMSRNIAKISDVPIRRETQLVEKYGEIVSTFYGTPSAEMTMIGITGTNGKSTISHLLWEALNKLGNKTGYIGTLGIKMNDYNEVLYPNTTLFPTHMQKTLKMLLDKNMKTVVMEVTSHRLDNGRMNGTNINIAAVTNLTQDHLNYHGTMEKYGKAKKRILECKGLKTIILNTDDKFCRELIPEIPDHIKIVSVRALSDTPPLTKDFIEFTAHRESISLKVACRSNFGNFSVTSRCLGNFQGCNLAISAAVLHELGYTTPNITKELSGLRNPIGRMDTYVKSGYPTVVIDFAHTPDALKNAIKSVKEAFSRHKVTTIFGCGGGRDKDKRPIMGNIASEYSDDVVITIDNPRFETPKSIINDIIAGITKNNYSTIVDRKKAIQDSINRLEKNGVILLAGKGHENYMEIKGRNISYSDINYLRALGFRRFEQDQPIPDFA